MIKSLFLALLAAALIAGGAFAVKAFWIEPRSLVITRADIAVPQWPAEARAAADRRAGRHPGGRTARHRRARRRGRRRRSTRSSRTSIVLLGDYVSLMRLSTSHVPPKATAAVLGQAAGAARRPCGARQPRLVAGWPLYPPAARGCRHQGVRERRPADRCRRRPALLDRRARRSVEPHRRPAGHARPGHRRRAGDPAQPLARRVSARCPSGWR